MIGRETEKLFRSITDIDDALIENAQPLSARGKKNPSAWKKWAAAAACVCLLAAGVIALLQRSALRPGADDPGLSVSSGASGAARIGGIFNGTLYYYRTDGSFWRYASGGAPEKLFSDRIFDYAFTETGVYYTKDLQFYYRAYDGDAARLLYAPPDPETDQLRFSFQDDGSVVLRIMDLKNEAGSAKPLAMQRVDSVRIDGETGEVLEILYEDLPFEDSIQRLDYRLESFRVGERTLHCVPDEHDGGVFYDVVENGQSLLPDGARTDGRVYRVGDGVMITVYDDPASPGVFWQLYLLPDGRGIRLSSNVFERDAVGENGRCLLYFYRDGILGAYDIETGERWPLETDAEIRIYDSATDGTHLYSTEYGSGKITLWELIYDASGRPTGMKLLSEDICV